MKTKKFFALVLSAVIMLSLLPTGAFAAVQNQPLTNEKMQSLSGYALGTGYYYMEEDITLGASLVIPSGAAVEVDLRGHTLSTTAQASVIKLEENASLTVNDSTANHVTTFGGTITNNLVSTGYVTEEFQGGGVYVSKGAKFTLNAGNIQRCGAYEAGGIYVASGGKAVMTGGVVYLCAAVKDEAAGGVYIAKDAEFEMSGGRIWCCFGNAKDSVWTFAGICLVNDGTMTISEKASISEGNRRHGGDTLPYYAMCNNGTVYANGGKIDSMCQSQTGVFRQTDESSTTTVTDNYYHSVLFYGEIDGGIFYNQITTYSGEIKSGIFHNVVNTNEKISGGTFYEEVVLGEDATLANGIFYGNVCNAYKTATVSGGTFCGETEDIPTVTFDTDGGSPVPTAQKRCKAPATEPSELPEKQDSVFLGWYDENGAVFDFSQEITSDITITAKYRDAEFFTLNTGETYYFDVSQVGIPGTVNDGIGSLPGENLPDATLHYVPFTYVGTVDTYALSAAGTAADAAIEARSMFLADANITVLATWNELNEKGFIFGKDYVANGLNYKMRAPTGGSSSAGIRGNMHGVPEGNDWDSIAKKNAAFIKVLHPASAGVSQTESYMQESSASDSAKRVARCATYLNISGGTYERNKWDTVAADALYNNLGYRPVLEISNSPAKDALQCVTLHLDGGSLDGSGTAKIVVKNGESFTAPPADGLKRPDGNSETCFYWTDSNGKIYAPGDAVPAGIDTLTACWTKTVTVSTAQDEYAYNYGAPVKPTVRVSDGSGTEIFAEYYDVSYENNIDVGTAKVTVRAKSGCNFEIEGSTTFRIAAREVEAAVSEADQAKTRTYTYTGSPITDSVNFVYACEGGKQRAQMKPTDYEITYENNINVGTARLCIRPAEGGNYRFETYKLAMTITSAPLHVSEVTIQDKPYDTTTAATVTEVAYTGLLGDETLSFGEDFTFAASFENANAGENKVVWGEASMLSDKAKNYHFVYSSYYVPTGQADGDAWKSKYFKAYADISQAQNAFVTALSMDDMTYGGERSIPKAAARFGDVNFTYSNEENGVYSNEFPSNAGRYYVKATVAENENYTSLEKTMAFEIKPKTLSDVQIPPIGDLVYSGEKIEPSIVVMSGAETIPADEYDVSYENNIDVGTATVRVANKPQGNYRFTASTTFVISRKTISNEIPLAVPVKYAVPQTSIKTDEYTAAVAWSPAVDDQFAADTKYTAIITITPKGNYTTDGIAENAYVVNGANTVTNEENATEITAEFPKTEKNSYNIRANKSSGGAVGVSSSGAGGSAVSPTETPLAGNSDNPFTDVSPSDWFFDSVKYASENGFMTGTTTTAFAPHEDISRAMFVTALWRAEGEPAVNFAMPFVDVEANAYYAEAVCWAAGEGIVKGMIEAEFAPDENITREQIAAMMFRYAQYRGMDVSVGANTNLLSYTDFAEISEYAIEAMQYAVGSGLMKGKTETALNPQDNATRAEIAAILQRFMGNK